jgi:hypothetical protein
MMQLINKLRGWFTMTESNLFTVCATAVLITTIGSVSYYHTKQSEMMSRNIENGIVKGVDPVAVRCAYAKENDNICVAYAVAKDHTNSPLPAKK